MIAPLAAGYPVHPAALAWPPLGDDELETLAESIRTVGLLEPIVLTPDRQLLDGRNRLAACRIAGVDPQFTTYDGDPIAFVAARNGERRHLPVGARAMATAVMLANAGRRKNGRWQYGSVLNSQTVGNSSGWAEAIRRAGLVIDWAPELADAVTTELMTLAAAVDVAKTRMADAEQARREAEMLDPARYLAARHIAAHAGHWDQTPAAQIPLADYGFAGIHPLAMILPALPADQFDSFCRSVVQRGFIYPVTADKATRLLIDGKIRLQVAHATGVPLPVDWAEPVDVADLIISRNLLGYSLTEVERSAADRAIATFTPVDPAVKVTDKEMAVWVVGLIKDLKYAETYGYSQVRYLELAFPDEQDRERVGRLLQMVAP